MPRLKLFIDSFVLSKAIVSLGFAFAVLVPVELSAQTLPPQILEKSFDWKKELRSLPQRKPTSIYTISTDSINHGALGYDGRGRRVWVLDETGENVFLYSSLGIGQFAPPQKISLQNFQVAERYLRERIYSRTRKELVTENPVYAHTSGYFEWEGRQLIYRLGADRAGRPLWSMDPGFEMGMVESEGDRSGSLAGWSAYPPKLFYMPRSMNPSYRIEWTAESEVVRYFLCSERRAVVVENLLNGFARFFFLENGVEPSQYTIFNFGGEKQPSDITWVESLSGCEDFVVAGSFGLVRIRYGR